MEIAMHLIPVPLGFTYRMDFVPKGARNRRSGLFKATDVAILRYIDVEETKPAFRIKRPELDILPLSRPRATRSNFWQYMRKAMSFEIVLYDGCLWWPNVYVTHEIEAAWTSADKCLADIKSDCSFFELQEINGCYDAAEEIPPIKELIADERDQKLAQAKRKAFENLMIVGERAYYRGGMPIYFRNYHGNKSVWEIDIASVGPDRHGDPRARGLELAPGLYGDSATEVALGKGHFWLATEYQTAIQAAHRRQTAFPEIEVLLPAAVIDLRREHHGDLLFPEIVNDVSQQIRLDSLFREVMRMFSHPSREHWNSEAFPSFKVAFNALSEPIEDNDQLSRRRLELLRNFVPLLPDQWELNRIRDDFTAFDTLQRCNPTWPEEISDEDLDVLVSLTD